MTAAIDPFRFREVLGQYPTGVSVITSVTDAGEPVGVVVGTFTSVSLNPPLVGFLPAKSSTTWPSIKATRRFCINVLSHHQEDVCRRFAMSGADRFEATAWRPAPSGAPILSGVVAWIDCALEAVHDAGDHEIVLGRVESLDIETSTLPLLFFQGGYGRFAPRSLAMADEHLAGELRLVDLARADMERVARQFDGRCLAHAVVDEQLVVVASAGRAGRRTPDFVGRRTPAVPGAATVFMAHEAPERVDRWLSHLKTEDEAASWRSRLAEVRAREYSVGVRAPVLQRLDELLRDGALFGAADNLEPEAVEALRALPLDPPGFTPAQASSVESIHVPVLDGDGRPRIALSLHVGFRRRLDEKDLEAIVAELRQVAERLRPAIGR